MATEAVELEKEKEEEPTPEVQLPEFDLDPELESEVEASVLAANTGKAKDELQEEIKAAKEAKRNELIEANKPILAKAAELKAIKENENKTDEELYELAQAELEKENPPSGDGEEEPALGEDFFGVAKPKAASEGSDGKPNEDPELSIPEAIKPQWERAKKITEDPLADIFFKAKEAGQVKDFLGLLNKMTPDPDQMSPAQLKETKIRFYDPNISEDDLKEAMDEFNYKKPYQQREEVADFAAQMRQARQADLKVLEGNVTSKATASKESVAKAVQEAEKELNGSYKGQVFYGVSITDQVASKVLNSIRQNGVSFTRPDGAPDVHKAIQAVLKDEYLTEMLQAAFDRGLRTATRKEAVRRSKPLTGLKARTSIPKPVTKNDRAEMSKIIKEKVAGKKQATS